MAIDFGNALSTLKTGIVNLAEKDVKAYVSSATADGQAILSELEEDLSNWTQELAAGAMTKDEFTELVLGQKDELEMVALKQVGLAEISADQFKLDIFKLITDTITALIP
jgi:hypothetical protein